MISLIFYFSPTLFDGMLQVSTKPDMQTKDFALTSQPMSLLQVSMLKLVFREILFSKLTRLFS